MDYFYKGSAIKKNAPVSWIAKADTLAANTNLVCVENVDNKKNSVLSVTAYFSAFTSLTVAHGYQMNYGNWCVVDGTNITTYYGTGATQMSQTAHGLTISEFLTVIIKQKTTQNAEITIMTAGGQFTTATVPHWHGSNGDVRMFGAQAMTDAELSYGLSDTRNDVFLFVDSYGTEGDSARVSRQIQNLGYDGFLALGHGGGNSAQTYPQFAKLIELAQPKVAVWMIGMNDPDSSSAINASWKSYAEQFAAACEARGIVPVFTTIPNVPNYQHTYKNAWIKESGYRYVDWAKAVGAEEAGSSWYTGMLSSNNVHPSELGAKALAMRTILDVPEIAPKVEGGGAVPEMATDPAMSDWTAGKVVDAGAAKSFNSLAMGVLDELDAEIALKANTADLATVATSGSYDDLTDKPTIPSLSGYATEQWVENKGYLTQHQSLANYQTKAITDTGGYYTTDTVEGALQEIGAELASAGSASVPRIAKASTDTTATIEPNKLYVFPEMASLTITLAAITDSTIVNEYHFIFESGSAATVLTLPATILQPDGFTVEANMHYEVSILEGAMTAQGWAVSGT